MSGKDAILSVRNLSVAYDSIEAVKGISFDVAEGEMVTLIGSNGAGKSSILRAISGMVPYEGTVMYDGKALKDIPAHRIVEMGISQVPEGRGIFGNLTVLENLKLATWQRKEKSEVKKDLERVYGLFPVLRERTGQFGGTLSGGEQQMLAVARSLMSRGRMMLLDEPSMGLSPVLVREIFEIIQEINTSGTTVLLVEQNALKALQAASRGYVLETGCLVLSGTGQELLNNPLVKKAYLG